MATDPIVSLDIHYEPAYASGEKFVACDSKVQIGTGSTPGEAVDDYWNRYGDDVETKEAAQ